MRRSFRLGSSWLPFLGIALGAALLLGGASPSSADDASSASIGRQPNIVFIMADDLGYGDLGCYGQKRIRTPNLDRMAAEGMRFTQVYAGSAVCAPSRSVLMTGQHTGHTRIRNNGTGTLDHIPTLLPEDVTVGQVLQDAGYATGAIGKWSLGEVGSPGFPGEKGFDFFFGFLNQSKAHFYYPTEICKNDTIVPLPANEDGKRGRYVHDLMTEEALRFIHRNQERPFFLYVPYTIPHAELLVPEDSLAEYRGKFEETPYVGTHYASQPTPNAALAGMITRMDRDIGRMFETLRELGLDDDTIVFFTSDNGPASAGGRVASFFDSSGPLRGAKSSLYEGGIREPMIVRWPGHVEAGTTSDAAWCFADVLPTLAEIAEAPLPETKFDGVSVLPTLLGQQQNLFDRPMYWEFYGRGFTQAARWRNWKAIRPRADRPLELYDLTNDVGESRDIAAEQPEVVAYFEFYMQSAHTDSPYWPVPSRETAQK